MKAHEMGIGGGRALTLPANVRDDPNFTVRANFEAVPIDQVKACQEHARAQLIAILAHVDQNDWPLTFWFSTPVLETPAPAGTRNVAVVLHVVGDGAGRRLTAIANRIQGIKAPKGP